MEKGLISTIQSYSTKDGPGIRSTVFLVGCNLRCKWCSNPELMLQGVKYMHFENRCIHCGLCVDVASNKAISFAEKGCKITRDCWTNAEECAEICPRNAYEMVGYPIDAVSLTNKLLRDRVFYEISGGGVTFSGGEPLLQTEFLLESIRLLHQAGIHVALDTAGHLPWVQIQTVVSEVDMLLYDIKAYDNAMHIKCTGVDNRMILNNLQQAASLGKKIIIRLIIVPGWNDELSDIKKRLKFIKVLGNSIVRVELLPYHDLGAGKYQRLGIGYPLEGKIKCQKNMIQKIVMLAKKMDLPIYYDGV